MKTYMVEYIVRTVVEAENADMALEVARRALEEMEARNELARECEDPQAFELDEEGNMI